jgi:hypothetical protein
MWFLFDAPAVVDEVRIFMRHADSDEIFKEVHQPIDIRWE